MKTKSHRIKLVMSVFALCALFFALFYLHFIEDREEILDYYEMSDHWDIETESEKNLDSSLEDTSFKTLERGDYVIFSTTIPETNITNPMIRFFSNHCSIEVYIDNDLIYEYGLERTIENKFIGYGFHYVALPPNSAGKKLVAREIASESVGVNHVHVPIIYDSTKYMVQYAGANKLLLALNIFMMVMGFGLFILALINYCISRRGMQLASIGGFAFFLSAWSMGSYHLYDIFTNDILLKNYMEYYALFFTPLFFLIYFWTDLKSRETNSIRITYKALVVAQFLFIIVVSITHILDLIHISAAIWGQLILILAEAIGILWICVHDIIHKNIPSKALFLGIISITVFALIDLIIFVSIKLGVETNGSYFSSVTCLGGIVFVVCLVWDSYLQNEKIKEEVYKMDALQKLAYTDPLTGVPNRRKFEDIIQELEKKNEDFALAAIDVNGLKYVNDTYGHEQGDLLINSMADCLKKTFGEESTIARMGGDEFAVIIPHERLKELESIFWRLQEEIGLKKEEIPELNLSAAYGYCKRSEFPSKGVKEIYRVADSRMYARKAQMKKEG